MLTPNQQLTVTNHRRDLAGMQYVYPVVSRRAGGLSIGINLNTNNACNWRCVYCQVENLKRGPAPEIDLTVLEAELSDMLREVTTGDFMQKHVPADLRRLNDIAISGNGEPTTSPQFAAVLGLIRRKQDEFKLGGLIKLVLITNGSQMHKHSVREAVRRMAEMNGEVWFKIDGGSSEAIAQVNQVNLSVEKVISALSLSAAACPTWIQSCFFSWKGEPPSTVSMEHYFDLLKEVLQRQIKVEGVLLYGVARPPLLPEGQFVGGLSKEWWGAVEDKLKTLGLSVKLSL